MAQKKIVQTAGREQLGEFAPEFARLNDDILFGEVWSRNDLLSLRDRSLVTITSLISQGITDNSLLFHLQSAKNNGITRTKIAEIITHTAFYAGWPKAWAAFNLAKSVWEEDIKGDNAKAAFEREMIFPIGEPNAAYARYFTGNSYLARISGTQIPFANVTFEPGCRNHWHIHHADNGGGQMLVGVAGKGWYQEGRKRSSENSAGHSDTHSIRRKTLARSSRRQLVCTSCIRNTRRKHLDRMARADRQQRIRQPPINKYTQNHVCII